MKITSEIATEIWIIAADKQNDLEEIVAEYPDMTPVSKTRMLDRIKRLKEIQTGMWSLMEEDDQVAVKQR